MVIVFRSENNDYRIGFLNDGKQKIFEFPLIKKYVNDFSDFTDEKYNNNVFLNLAVSAKRNENQPNANQWLNYLEEILTLIEVANLRRSLINGIASKMRSFEHEQNYSIYREFLFYHFLRSNSRISSINYDNFANSTHDFRFNIENVEFNLEFTGLNEGGPDKELSLGFKRVADRLLQKLPENGIIRLSIDSSKLLDGRDRFDKTHFVPLVLDEIDRIFPIITVKEGWFFFANIGNSSKSLWELKDQYEFYSELGERLEELAKTPDGVDYLKSMKCSFVHNENTLATSVSFHTGRFRAVEIQTEFSFPSKTQDNRKKYLLGQLSRAIERKINDAQLSGQLNPIICVHFEDTLFKGYSDGSLFGIDKYLTDLKDTINGVFSRKGDISTLGVLLLETKFEKSIFFRNHNVRIKKNVLGKIRKVWQDVEWLERAILRSNTPKPFDLKAKPILTSKRNAVERKIVARVKKSIVRKLFNRRKYRESDSSSSFVKLGNSVLMTKEPFVRLPRWKRWALAEIYVPYSDGVEYIELKLVIDKILESLLSGNTIYKLMNRQFQIEARAFGEALDEALIKLPSANLILTNFHDSHKFFLLGDRFIFSRDSKFIRGTFDGLTIVNSKFVPEGKTILLNSKKIGHFVIKKDITAVLNEIKDSERESIKKNLKITDEELDIKVRLLIEETVQFIAKNPAEAVLIITKNPTV